MPSCARRAATSAWCSSISTCCPRARCSTTPRCRWRWRACRPDRKSTRLNSSHSQISYAVFCLKKKKKKINRHYVDNKCKDEKRTPCNAETTEHKYAISRALTQNHDIRQTNVSYCRAPLYISILHHY